MGRIYSLALNLNETTEELVVFESESKFDNRKENNIELLFDGLDSTTDRITCSILSFDSSAAAAV